MSGTDHLSEEVVVRSQTGQGEIIDALAPEWSRLCDQLPDGEPFFRPEWIRACLLAFFPTREVILLSAWSGDRLMAVLPLMKEKISLGGLPAVRLTVVATVHSLRVGLVRRKGKEGDDASRAIWKAIQHIAGWDILDAPYALEGSGFEFLATLAREAGCKVTRNRLWQSVHLPIAPLAGKLPKDAQPPWMVNTRPKFRANLRRARRQLEEQGAVTLRHIELAEPEALEKFYALEASGWKGQQGTAINNSRNTRLFYDEVARAAAQRGQLSLDFLELGGRPIAAHFSLCVNGRYFLAKAGYDESFHRHGPGQLLVSEILNETPVRGLRELDFVGPGTWDEGRWAVSRRNHFHIFIFRNSFYGGLLHFIRISVRDAVKSLLGRRKSEDGDLPLLSPPQGGE